MEEFYPQARYREESFTSDFLFDTHRPYCIKNLRAILKYFLATGRMHDCVRIYSHSYVTKKFLRTDESVKILIEELVGRARQCIAEKTTFQISSFFCQTCQWIMKDPVTLKCGHTVARACALVEARKEGSFQCKECGNYEDFYSVPYLDSLKTNVLILSLSRKLSELYPCPTSPKPDCTSENTLGKTHEGSIVACSNEENPSVVDWIHRSVALHSLNSVDYYSKGNTLANHGNWKDSLISYLISITLDSNVGNAETEAIKIMKWLLGNREPSIEANQLLRSNDHNSCLNAHEDYLPISSFERPNLHEILDSFFDSIEEIGDKRSILEKIDISLLDEQEFECPCCMRLLWDPITTTCGHVFCKSCLYRSLDHRPTCPICKGSLADFLAEHSTSTTTLLKLATRTLYSDHYEERLFAYQTEKEELARIAGGCRLGIPIYEHTVALPSVTCSIHVYEPHYKLMIRRCVESGGNRFGMCEIGYNKIGSYGTLLQIREVKYSPDGGCIVQAYGLRRFKICNKRRKDGYTLSDVEFIQDYPYPKEDQSAVLLKLDIAYNQVGKWFNSLKKEKKEKYILKFGPMPSKEQETWPSRDGPSWLWWILAVALRNTKLKVECLSVRSMPERLFDIAQAFSYV